MVKKEEKRRITIQDRRVSHAEEDEQQTTEDQAAAEPVPEQEQTTQVDWERQAMENLELARRKQADLENFRKRSMQEKDEVRRNAVEALLYDLFPALDGLSQAAHTFKDRADGEDPLLDGVRSTIKVLDGAFERHGIERINEAGVPFDSKLHQPLSVVDGYGIDVDTVDEIYTEGYRLGERVLKPAMVRVARAARPEGEAAEEGNGTEAG